MCSVCVCVCVCVRMKLTFTLFCLSFTSFYSLLSLCDTQDVLPNMAHMHTCSPLYTLSFKAALIGLYTYVSMAVELKVAL